MSRPPAGFPVGYITYECGCKILLDVYGWACGRKNCEFHDHQATEYLK